MRIAVSADNDNGLESVVSPHFGRCPYFVLVDLDEREVKEVRAMPNPFYGHHQPGQVPGFIDSQNVNVMLTGGMGGRAIAFFEQYGIQPVTGATGTVRRALEYYLRGELREAAPCRESLEHAHTEMPAEGEYEQDDLGRLREEADLLKSQLDEVMTRLNALDREDG